VDLPKSSSAAAGAGSGGFTENDIEFMKKAIQILCQSTNPLGKSIDFVTDDIDSMSKEYDYWRRESQSCQSKLEEQ
jgi:TRAF3-interacting protein 1